MKMRLAIVVLLSLTVVIAEAALTSFPAPGPWPTGMTYDGNVLYVSEPTGSPRIYRLDPNGGAVLGVFSFPAFGRGTGAAGSLQFDGVDRLFATNLGRVVEIAAFEPDGAPHTQFNSFTVPFRAKGMTFDGTNLYLHDWDSGRFMITDRGGTLVADLNTGLRISDMVFDASRGSIWALEAFIGRLSELATDGTVLRRCIGGRGSVNDGLTLVGPDFYISFINPAGVGTIHVVPKNSLVCDRPLVTTVSIDIKPGSDPNSINVNGNGSVPVAILTTSVADGDAFDFDATLVDGLTVRFGPAEAAKTHLRQPLGHIEDVDGDGDLDLLLHFLTQETGIACGDTEATLTGETLDGYPREPMS